MVPPLNNLVRCALINESGRYTETTTWLFEEKFVLAHALESEITLENTNVAFPGIFPCIKAFSAEKPLYVLGVE